MKRILGCSVALGLLSLTPFAYAFVEPTGTAATFPSPIIINVGPGSQTKSGDLTVRDLKAPGVTLGEERRTSWLAVGSACAWSGWRCDCRSDDSTMASMMLTFGVQCSGQRVSDMKLVSMRVNEETQLCSSVAPSPCSPALYTRVDVGGRTFFDSVKKAVVVAVVTVVKFIKKLCFWC